MRVPRKLVAAAGAGALALLALALRPRRTLATDDLHLDTATLELTPLAPRIGRVTLVQSGRVTVLPADAVLDRLVLDGTAHLTLFAGESEDDDGVSMTEAPELMVSVTQLDPKTGPRLPHQPPRRAGSSLTVLGRVGGVARRCWVLGARDAVMLRLRGGPRTLIYSGRPREAFAYEKPTPDSARPVALAGEIRVSVGTAASLGDVVFHIEH